MARAPRKLAEDVQVGDLILNCYAPRTWRAVTAVLNDDDDGSIGLDTAKDRTWWELGQLVPCKAAK